MGILVGACTEDKAPVPTTTPPTKVQKPYKVDPELEPLDRDGVLRPTASKVFAAPLPVKAHSIANENRWAGYETSYAHSEVVEFYEKHLAETHTLDKRRNGVKLSPKAKDGAQVYIPKPRIAGAPTRIYYFARGEVEAPPFVAKKNNGVRRRAPSKAPPGASNANAGSGSSGRSAGGNGASNGGNGSHGGLAQGSGGDAAATNHYTERVTRDSQGRKVVILDPAPPESNTPNTANGAKRSRPNPLGTGRGRRVNLPPNHPQ